MSVYRCYFFNELGSITDWTALDCATDADAEVRATALLGAQSHHHAVEVWELGRRTFQHARTDALLHKRSGFLFKDEPKGGGVMPAT